MAARAARKRARPEPCDDGAEAVADNARRFLADARRDERLALFDLRVLEMLADREIIRASGQTPPSDLAGELGISHRSLKRIVARLARFGYVTPAASSRAA